MARNHVGEFLPIASAYSGIRGLFDLFSPDELGKDAANNNGNSTSQNLRRSICSDNFTLTCAVRPVGFDAAATTRQWSGSSPYSR